MRFLIQRVDKASVSVDEKIIGSIDSGYLVLLGVCENDDEKIADAMIKKMMNLRIFSDENGKTNLSIQDVKGELLIVSQFTLYADCSHGNRPSFVNAGSAEHANLLYEYVLQKIKDEYDIKVETGSFGAHMKVDLVNNGPFTIMLDSDTIKIH